MSDGHPRALVVDNNRAALALDRGAPEQVREKLEQAKISAQNAVELVRKISQSSAYGIIDRETRSIESVLQRAVATFSAEPAPDIAVVLESGDTQVSIDREQIDTALVNVLRNSVEAGATRISPSVTSGGTSILLVENDEPTSLVAAAMIEFLGLEVVSAAETDQALARYRQALEQGVRFAAVLINLRDEDDPQAVELCRHLRAIDPDLRIIATSGMPVGPVMARCRDYGFANALPKPYTVDDLRNILALGSG